MTFSLCVRESTDNGTIFGVAVATDAPAVGALAPFVGDRGAISTQAFVNVRLSRRGLALLDDVPLRQALSGIFEYDENHELRQLHGISEDDVFAHTGTETDGWSGHKIYSEDGLTVAGNMLTGPETLPAVADAYLTAEGTDEPDRGIVPRLLDALDAGATTGGDKRGHSSAAIAVSAPQTTAYHDLRVDHNPEPIMELRRVYEGARDASDGFSEDSKKRIFD